MEMSFNRKIKNIPRLTPKVAKKKRNEGENFHSFNTSK
jgi:hypothetical protein